MKLEKLRRVIAPLNGTQGDARLLEALASLCVRGASRIVLVYVVEMPMTLPLDAEVPAQLDRGERVLARAEVTLRTSLQGADAIVMTELLQARSAGPAICDTAADHDAHLIVMATQNRHHHGTISYGTSVDHVLKHASAEVIVIRLARGEDSEQS
ncbi:MAG: universal stress protein [Thermomicrobiales bacterium]|nr:universal stress protein [Thermomicrobiales bacterium]